MSLLTSEQKAKIEAELKAKSDALVAQLLAGRLPTPAASEESVSCSEQSSKVPNCSNSVIEDEAIASTVDSCRTTYRQVMDVRTSDIQPGEGNAALPLQSPSAEMSGHECTHVVHTFDLPSPCATTPPNVRTMCVQNGVEVASELPDSSDNSVGSSRERLTKRLIIRLSPADKIRLQTAADAAGFRSTADFLRSKIPGFSSIRRPRKDAEIKKLMAGHNAIGSNINQIARFLNSNKSGNTVDLLSILAVLQEIKEKLDSELNKIVGEEK